MTRKDVRARLAQANRSIESASRSFERHSQRIMRMEVKGQDTSKVVQLRDRAEVKLKKWMKAADFLRAPAYRAQATEQRVNGMLASVPKPPQESERQRKARGKSQRQREAAHAVKTKVLSSAAIEFDPRLASADRDLHVDNLGSASRARSLTYTALFAKRMVDATATRVAACSAFDDTWHTAHVGEFPEPRFEPQVDSTRSEHTHQEAMASAKLKLQAIHTAIGPYLFAIAEQRIVRNTSYVSISRTMGIAAHHLPKQFIQAVDGIAVALGLVGQVQRSRIRAYRAPRATPDEKTDAPSESQ